MTENNLKIVKFGLVIILCVMVRLPFLGNVGRVLCFMGWKSPQGLYNRSKALFPPIFSSSLGQQCGFARKTLGVHKIRSR